MAGWLTAFHNLRHDDHHLYQLQIAKPIHEWLVLVAREYGSDRETTANQWLEVCFENPSPQQLDGLISRLKVLRDEA